MQTAYKQLKDSGFDVGSWGLFANEEDPIYLGDVILLPVPTTLDGKTVNCPITKSNIELSCIDNCKENALILTAGYDFKRENQIDYLQLDSFCLLNAVPTAEGAIAKAIDSTDICLWKSNVLVIGFGRVGKILADRLKGMRCNLTVSARKDSDFALVDSLGANFVHTEDVRNNLLDYDFIFNTIDVPLGDNALEQLRGRCLIDLSSKGCIDFHKARERGLSAFKLPGLPGKTAPVTAGKIIAQTVTSIVQHKT